MPIPPPPTDNDEEHGGEMSRNLLQSRYTALMSKEVELRNKTKSLCALAVKMYAAAIEDLNPARLGKTESELKNLLKRCPREDAELVNILQQLNLTEDSDCSRIKWSNPRSFRDVVASAVAVDESDDSVVSSGTGDVLEDDVDTMAEVPPQVDVSVPCETFQRNCSVSPQKDQTERISAFDEFDEDMAMNDNSDGNTSEIVVPEKRRRVDYVEPLPDVFPSDSCPGSPSSVVVEIGLPIVAANVESNVQSKESNDRRELHLQTAPNTGSPNYYAEERVSHYVEQQFTNCAPSAGADPKIGRIKVILRKSTEKRQGIIVSMEICTNTVDVQRFKEYTAQIFLFKNPTAPGSWKDAGKLRNSPGVGGGNMRYRGTHFIMEHLYQKEPANAIVLLRFRLTFLTPSSKEILSAYSLPVVLFPVNTGKVIYDLANYTHRPK